MFELMTVHDFYRISKQKTLLISRSKRANLNLTRLPSATNTQQTLPGKTLRESKDTIMAISTIPNILPVKKLDHFNFRYL